MLTLTLIRNGEGFALFPFKLDISLSNCVLCTFGGEPATPSAEQATGSTQHSLISMLIYKVA